MTSHRFLLADWSRGEGLGIPSLHLGCHIVGSLASQVSSTCAQLVLLVTLLALCFLRSRQAQMLDIMAGMFQKDLLVGYLLVTTHLALYSFSCRQAQMLGISACMEQKDSSIRALVVILALACAKLVLLVTLHLALFLFFPVVGPRCSASLPVWTRRTVILRHGAVRQGRRHFFHGAEADSLGLVGLQSFPSGVWIRWSMSLFAGRAVCCAGPAMRAQSWETAELPQLQLVELWTGCCMPVVCNDKRRWSMTWRSSSTALVVPVIMQRRLRQWTCSIFSSSPELVDIFVRNRGVGMVAALRGRLMQFCSIFRPPSIWTLRPRVAGTPGV